MPRGWVVWAGDGLGKGEYHLVVVEESQVARYLARFASNPSWKDQVTRECEEKDEKDENDENGEKDEKDQKA